MRGIGRGGQKWQHDGRERPMHVVDLDGGDVSRREAPGRNHGRGAAILQTMVLLGLVDQRDLARLGVAQRCGAANHQLAVANDLPTDQRRKLGKSGLHDADSFPG